MRFSIFDLCMTFSLFWLAFFCSRSSLLALNSRFLTKQGQTALRTEVIAKLDKQKNILKIRQQRVDRKVKRKFK